ncbi:ATP-binding protein [Seleniivibrio woodruffii]|uniref:ATP-binding protein n=1 Tax=Seleniivibrio woodruffii TaxID=1078050 RepID=UPI0039E50FF1
MSFLRRRLTADLSLTDIVSLILLSALGFAGNYFKIGIFFNVDFLFGSIFTMYAVKRYGMIGVIPAFIASLYTYTLWNHPYAIIIFTSEALFVAFLRRKAAGVIVHDLIYWLTAGLLLIFISYHFIMDVPVSTVKLVILKQSINGIVNTVCATILFYGVNYYGKITGSGFRRISFRQTFFILILMIAAFPAIAYVVFGVKTQTNEITGELKDELNTMYNMTSISIESLLDEAYGKINGLADKAASEAMTDSATTLDEHIETVLNSSEIFIGMAFLSPDAKAEHVYIKADEKVKRFSNVDFSGSGYYEAIGKTDATYVSEATKSSFRPEGTHVIVIIKPVKDESGYLLGFMQASMNFDKIQGLMRSVSKDSGIDLTLSDKNSTVIINTSGRFKGGNKFSYPEGYAAFDHDSRGIFMSAPIPQNNHSVMIRWSSSFYVKSGELAPSGLKLTAQMPLALHMGRINDIGYRALKIIYLVIILCIAAAMIISRQISLHLENLQTNTGLMPEKIRKGEKIPSVQSVFAEITDLSDHFSAMSRLLSEKFGEISRQKGELSLIMDSIPLIIFMKDTENNIISVNRTAAESMGLSASGTVKLNVYKHFPSFADRVYHDDIKVITSRSPLLGIIQKYNSLTVKTDKIPVLNEKGQVTSILVISRDITDELKAQEEKQRTLETLYQQSKMAEMGAMTAAIAHQWKQPLSTVSILTQMIESEISDGNLTNESLLTYTGLMLKNTDFMSQTADDFTHFFKTEKKKQMFRPCDTITEIYGIIDSQFRRYGIEFITREHAHFSVYGFKNEFKQVCLNLLVNAKDALAGSKKEDKRIEVAFSQDDNYRIMTFEDNGGGISEELLPDRLFEMYQTSKGESGTGIGLYICRSIIENHMGGKITAENTDKGARFTIYLPSDQTIAHA